MNEKYFVLLFVVTAVLPPVVVSLVALASVGGVGRPAQLVHAVRVTAAPPPAQGRRLTLGISKKQKFSNFNLN